MLLLFRAKIAYLRSSILLPPGAHGAYRCDTTLDAMPIAVIR
jgi:hypothetical protein